MSNALDVNSNPKFATVVLDSAMNRTFDYSVPQSMRHQIQLGSKVRVSFRKNEVSGYVVDLPLRPEVFKLKPIEHLEALDPFVSGTALTLSKWVAQYYGCSLATAFRSVFPLSLRNTTKKRRSSFEAIEYESDVADQVKPELTEEQVKILEQLSPVLEKKEKEYFPFLLHGVTGSGKTEIYLRALEATLNKGKRAIVIVPEISLTPQTVVRFQSRFDQKIAVWHSQLTPAQRRDQWNRIKRGEINIVIGARSAIFAPITELGLIVVDEEHEKSYKQTESPRYHARDLAVMRAYIEKSVIILGSATPALESYFNVEKKKYNLGTLEKRIDDRPLPPVHIIDMKEVFKRQKGLPVYSSELLDAIRKRLENKEQVILFLNRRGYSNFVLCKECGHVLECENCSLSLTYHQNDEVGRCHLCGYAVKMEKTCSKCKQGKMSLLGLGTQKVETQIKKIFPEARIERLDSDTTAKRGHSEKVLQAFKKGEIDILIGTQMIAKGLDFPNVTLTGVILADVTLHVPDFRSGEYTFQLLTQVAGRAGRGQLPGEVFIQTFTPNHPSIQAAKEHDFHRFYETEMQARQELNYPPYFHFMIVTLQGKKEERVKEVAELFGKELRNTIGSLAEVLGPTPAPISRANKYYRWQFVLRGKSVLKMSGLVQKLTSKWSRQYSIQFLVDVDPTIML